MLAAAVYAIYEAENATPADAPSKFTAGVINGFNPAVDVSAEMAECFAPDQAMADDVDSLMAAIESKDFGSIKAIIAKDEPLAIKDTSLCMSDPKYAAIQKAYQYQEDIVKTAMADPDWQLHALKGIKGQISQIKDNATAALGKWNAGDYYGAGQLIGAIDKIVFTYWETNQTFLQ